MTAAILVRAAEHGGRAGDGRDRAPGLRTYAAFTPPGWQPPVDVAVDDMIAERLALPRACALVADVGDEPAGHVILLAASDRVCGRRPGARARHPGLRARALWGSGVAAALHARMVEAAARPASPARCLFVLAAQSRARGFYEREGWSAAGPPAFEPALDIDVVEYRRELR